MVNYLLIFRSLTQAQRAVDILRNSQIQGTLVRSPKSLAGEGCSHSIRISDRQYNAAIQRLRQSRVMPRRVFYTGRDGASREVAI